MLHLPSEIVPATYKKGTLLALVVAKVHIAHVVEETVMEYRGKKMKVT